MLGGSKTCFRISIEPKMTLVESKMSENQQIKTFVEKLNRVIAKLISNSNFYSIHSWSFELDHKSKNRPVISRFII